MQQSTHIIPQCDTATAGVWQDVFSQQCLGRPRWQTTGSPGSWLSSQTQAHRAQHSHRRGVLRSVMEGNTVFSQGKPVCPVCAFPSLASSLPFVVRLFGQVLHMCVYVVLLWHMYILLGTLTSKIYGDTCCPWFRLRAGYRSVTRTRWAPSLQAREKGGWKRHGLRVKVRKARGRKPYDCYQCCGNK